MLPTLPTADLDLTSCGSPGCDHRLLFAYRPAILHLFAEHLVIDQQHPYRPHSIVSPIPETPHSPTLVPSPRLSHLFISPPPVLIIFRF